MKRHPENNNLRLIYDKSYEGFDVQHWHAPLIEEYLSRALYVARLALLKHPRTFAFRVDLRFPANQLINDAQTNQPLDRFFKSLQAKIKHNRLLRAKERGGSANPDIELSEISASMGDGNRLPRSRSNEKTPP